MRPPDHQPAPRHRRGLSFQNRFIGTLVGLAFLPIVIVTWLSIRVMTEQLETELADKADRSLTLVDTLIRVSEEELLSFGEILAADASLQTDMSLGSHDEIGQILLDKQTLYHADRLLVLDEWATIVAQAGGFAPSAGPLDTPLLIKARASQQGTVGLHVDRGQVWIAAVCPILVRGDLIGFVQIARKMEQRFVEKIKQISGADITLFVDADVNATTLDQQTARMMRSQLGTLPASATLTPANHRRVLGESVMARTMLIRDVDRRTIALLMVSIPRTLTRNTQALIAKTIELVAFMILIIAGLIGFLLARGITQPIRSLVHATKSIAAGDFKQRVPVISTDELGELSEAFNRMASEIEQLMQSEKALAAANAQAEMEKRRAEELERAYVELERSNAELEQFAYVASHDLQEPLRVVAGYVQLLGRRYQGRLDAQADEFINFSVDGVRRMQQLINDLLAYSRVQHAQHPLEPIDLGISLTQALANLQMAIAESAAQIDAGMLPTVVGDAAQMTQVFQNLIANAMKFRGSRAPRIQVTATHQDDAWTLAVRDNGIGLEPQYAQRIFVIFQRLHTAAQYPGTGIGLAICKKIVERHGGRIWVESTPGAGACFFFTIPDLPPEEPIRAHRPARA